MDATATDISRSGSIQVFNLLVRVLDGKTLALKLSSPSVRGHALKHRLFETTGIPPNHQRLVTGVCQIEDDSVVSCSGEPSGRFPTIHLLLRILGGKGGFGSLLRGAATKAGQKKTNNFDACRDMSGRRLRHVNAEKRLEEWKAEEEERKLEKVAEEFLKKKSKVGKKGVGDSAAQKYVEKYREESARCVAGVEESVRDAVMNGGNGKRKGGLKANGADAKKLKIWMGKQIMGESDSENSDGYDDTEGKEEIEKFVILSGDCQFDLNKDAKGSLDYVNFVNHVDGSGGISCENGFAKENMAVQENVELIGSSIEKVICSKWVDGAETCSEAVVSAYEEDGVEPCSEVVVDGANGADEKKLKICESDNWDKEDGHKDKGGEGSCESVNNFGKEGSSGVSCESGFPNETTSANTNDSLVAASSIDGFSCAEDMEYLGLERLKMELKMRGLKCGGTLKERAARLFLLKSIPWDKYPKKHLAKK